MIHLLKRLRAFLSTRNGILYVPLAMYAVKAIVQWTLGSLMHSPSFTSNGSHSGSDFAVNIIEIVALRFAMIKAENYPFGRKNIEYIATLAIGILLASVTINLFYESALGVVHFIPSLDVIVRSVVTLPQYEAVRFEGSIFPIAVVALTVFILLSIIVGRFQVSAGKRVGSSVIVADGQETLSDTWVELAILISIIIERLFGVAWPEPLFGLAVTGLLGHTTFEICRKGVRGLLHRSVSEDGHEHEDHVTKIAKSIYGVDGVAEIKMFFEGPTVICILKAYSRCSADVQIDIKHAMAMRIIDYLRAAEFVDADYFIRFDPPPPNRHRLAYAVVKERGERFLAPTIATATHLIIADVKHGEIVRWTEEVKPNNLADTITLLGDNEKRVLMVYTWEVSPVEILMLADAGIRHEYALSPDLATLGVPST